MTDPYAQPPHEPMPSMGLPTAKGAQPGAPWYPPPGYSAEERKTSGFAIAALVFGIIGGALLAIIFGIIALVQIPKKNQKGKGMAIAGVVLGAFWTLAIAAAFVSVVITSAGRDSTGEITESGDVSATALQVGDCLNDIEESQMITSFPAVPCDQPHEAEVIGTFDLPDGDYPTEDELVAQADQGCVDEMARYPPEAMSNPALGFLYIYPLKQAWPADREVVCLVTSSDGTMTGSLVD